MAVSILIASSSEAGFRFNNEFDKRACDEQVYRSRFLPMPDPLCRLDTRLSAVVPDALVEGGDVRAVLGAPAIMSSGMTPCLTAFLAFLENWQV
jgi:hypothetical protein